MTFDLIIIAHCCNNGPQFRTTRFIGILVHLVLLRQLVCQSRYNYSYVLTIIRGYYMGETL